MWTVVSALKSEIRPLFDVFSVEEKLKFAEGSLYQCKGLHILRTGIGNGAARSAFSGYLQKFNPQKVLNLGLAGALGQNLKHGQMCNVHNVHHADHPQSYDLNLLQGIPDTISCMLLTVVDAVTDANYRNLLYGQYRAELVDMGAFVLAKICNERHIPFYALKIISDFADHNAERDFKKNYQLLSKKLCSNIVSYL